MYLSDMEERMVKKLIKVLADLDNTEGPGLTEACVVPLIGLAQVLHEAWSKPEEKLPCKVEEKPKDPNAPAFCKHCGLQVRASGGFPLHGPDHDLTCQLYEHTT